MRVPLKLFWKTLGKFYQLLIELFLKVRSKRNQLKMGLTLPFFLFFIGSIRGGLARLFIRSTPLPGMKRTRVKIHHSLLDSELWLVLGILGLAILTPSWVAGHFLLFLEEGLTIQAGTPNQEAEYSSGSIIHFYLTLINPTGTVSTQLYFWKEGEQPTVIHSLAVRQGIFSYDLDTISLEDGVYHWYVEAYPFDAATVVTPTYTLYLGDTPIPSVGSGSI